MLNKYVGLVSHVYLSTDTGTTQQDFSPELYVQNKTGNLNLLSASEISNFKMHPSYIKLSKLVSVKQFIMSFKVPFRIREENNQKSNQNNYVRFVILITYITYTFLYNRVAAYSKSSLTLLMQT